VERLCDDPQLQHYLHPSDHGCRAVSDTDVELVAQQRFSRINRDVQRRVKHVQDEETAFRSLPSFVSLFATEL